MSVLIEKYKHQPLRPERNEIRLLRLMPGSSDDKLKIEIFHADATLNPDYEALSYVWGPSDSRHAVLIKAKRQDDLSLESGIEELSQHETRSKLERLPITRNLSTALSYLRLPDTPRTLWIDAISINQDDEDEKGREVRKMGEIYGQARQVVVWLGEGREDSSVAIATLRYIGESIHIFDDGKWQVKPGSEAFHLESELSDPRAARADVLTWMAIRNVFNASWFTRLWVFQEIGRAADAIFMVGNQQISRNALWGAFLWIRNLKQLSETVHILDENTIQVAWPVFEHFSVQKSSGDTSLLDLINWTKLLRCYDPRDRIYALLSLLDQDEAAKIIPSYNSTVEQVYTNAILNNIEFTKSLNIFDICDFAKADSKLVLPSWVPDFSVPNPIERNIGWHAAGLSAVESRYDEAKGTLCVRGRNVCTINYAATPIPVATSLAEILAICHAWEPHDASDTDYPTEDTLMDAFIATLFVGCCSGYPEFTDNPELLSIASMKVAYRSLVVKGVISTEHRPYAEALQRVLPGRTFFTTREGYVGLCPASAQPGDQIFIAFGSHSPLVLRPVPKRKSHYQVGGTCFVYGLMHGEGILGPLPNRWTHSSVERRLRTTFVFIRPSRLPTQFDPRAGSLPPRWKVCYYDGPQKHRKEIDREGNLRDQQFENEETKEVTKFDPRLTSESLGGRGIDLQDIILV